MTAMGDTFINQFEPVPVTTAYVHDLSIDSVTYIMQCKWYFAVAIYYTSIKTNTISRDKDIHGYACSNATTPSSSDVGTTFDLEEAEWRLCDPAVRSSVVSRTSSNQIGRIWHTIDNLTRQRVGIVSTRPACKNIKQASLVNTFTCITDRWLHSLRNQTK